MSSPIAFHRQSGAALVVSLLMLSVMTIIGVTALSGTTLQEKMAGNLRNDTLAFEAAEAGLRDAEYRILEWSGEPQKKNNSCEQAYGDECVWLYGEANPATKAFHKESAQFWNKYARTYSGGPNNTNLPELASQPKTIIELRYFRRDDYLRGFGPTTGRHYYRITSRGVGGTESAVSVLQSSTAKRFN